VEALAVCMLNLKAFLIVGSESDTYHSTDNQ